MTNPVDAYLETAGKNKTAGWLGDAGKAGTEIFSGTNVGGHLAGAALAGGLGYVLPRATNKIYRAITKTRDFRSMMEANPDLQTEHDKDPKQFNRHFTSLRNMAPEFTADPVIAGTYMRRLSANPSGAGTMILEAASMAPGHGTSSFDVKSKYDNHESNIKYQPSSGVGKAKR